MRKIIVLSFVSLDGVMQAPGGPEEDTSSGFQFGGWTAPYFHAADQAAGDMMAKQMKSADLLLGRKTFEIFASFWPKHADFWPGINDVTKYVVSQTMDKSDWQNTVFLKSVDDIKKLKGAQRVPTFKFTEVVTSSKPSSNMISSTSFGLKPSR